jgi:hypothetical protein
VTVAELRKVLENFGPGREVRLETDKEVDVASKVELDGDIVYIVGRNAHD